MRLRSNRARIAFLLGDAGGVGPEMGAKLLSDPDIRGQAEILLIGDPVVLSEAERIAGVSLPVHRVSAASDPLPAGDVLGW